MLITMFKNHVRKNIKYNRGVNIIGVIDSSLGVTAIGLGITGVGLL